jgi:Fe-S cluster assembly protein SufD
LAEQVSVVSELRGALSDDAIRSLSSGLGEPAELREKRLWAARRHAETGLPDRVRHLWRYTDPSSLVPATGLDLRGTASDIVVELSSEAREAGVEAIPLSRIGAELDVLGAAVPARHGLFEALNMAAWGTGLLVRVPAGTVLGNPVRVIVQASGATVLPRLLVLVGEGADLSLVEEHTGGVADTRVVGVAEIRVGEGARLKHVVLQGWSSGTRGHLTHRTVLERDSRALTVVSSLGGRQLKHDLGVVLAGEGAHSEILGMSLGEARQHVDLHTEHRHEAAKTTSQMDIRVALAGKARSAYTGLIRIERDAGGCEAFQKNRNLLLSRRARAETIPELEILNSDVSCTHGATASPVDPAQLFYLQSRGLPPDEAARLIVRGFFEPVLERIPSPLREQVSCTVEERVARMRGATG